MKFPRFSIKNSQDFQLHLLPPHHLIHNPHIALNNLHDLRADILIDTIRNWNTVAAISAELHSSAMTKYCTPPWFSKKLYTFANE